MRLFLSCKKATIIGDSDDIKIEINQLVDFSYTTMFNYLAEEKGVKWMLDKFDQCHIDEYKKDQ